MKAETPCAIKIVGLGSGEGTPFDGQWVVEYDPTRQGTDPLGRPMLAYLVTTDDPARAAVFEGPGAALATWKRAEGFRADGEPNRPLAAFSVTIQRHPCPPAKKT